MDEGSDEAAWPEALQWSRGAARASEASFAARLDRWVTEARVEGAADACSMERWLHAAAEADATFGGVLLDLAERGTAVAVSTRSDHRHHGSIEAVGADFVALRLPTGSEVLLALGAVISVRTAPLADAALGEQALTTDLRLGDVLSELAAERSRVLLVPVGSAEPVSGELRAVGRDVVTIRTDGDPPATTYLPLPSIAEVALS